jgi:hypothetical protein
MSNEMNRRAILAGTAALPATVLPAAALATGDDPHSALARLEHVIHVLRNCYIYEGWKLDEEGAEHALKYFRRTAARGRWNDEDHEAEQIAAFDFLFRHGQSLDWIIGGDPGGMIAHGAALDRIAAA